MLNRRYILGLSSTGRRQKKMEKLFIGILADIFAHVVIILLPLMLLIMWIDLQVHK